MSIKTAAILVDGTVAITAGTSTTFIGKESPNGTRVVLDDASAFIDQTTIDFQVKEPKISSSAPNGYTQARNTVRVKEPKLLDNGAYTVNTGGAEFSFDPETSDADKLSMRVLVCNLIMDGDFTAFWDDQSND